METKKTIDTLITNENTSHSMHLQSQKQESDKDLFNSIIQSIIINRQLPMLMNNEGIENIESSLVLLCKTAEQIFLKEDSLLDLESPIKVCGDVHGQLNDLLNILQKGGFENDSKYLFLGDYIDRGPNSLEVICLLFALKCVYPTKIYLLRGNHESPEMAESFGFTEEIEKKLGQGEFSDSIINAFYDTFDCLPISALINDDIFCVHGGISPELDRIEDLLRIKRPVQIPDKGVIADLLWSDPDKKTFLWGPNERGFTFTWGHAVATEFITKNKLSMIIRAHQMAAQGIDFPFYPDQRVITVFSASNYTGVNSNVGAFIEIEEDPPTLNFTLLKSEVPPKEKSEQNEPKIEKENIDCNNNNENTDNCNISGDHSKINRNVSCDNQSNNNNIIMFK